MRASLITSAPTPGSADSPRLPDESDESAAWWGAARGPNSPGARSGTRAPAPPAPLTPPDVVLPPEVDRTPPPRATNPITPAAERKATSAKAILLVIPSRPGAIRSWIPLGRNEGGESFPRLGGPPGAAARGSFRTGPRGRGRAPDRRHLHHRRGPHDGHGRGGGRDGLGGGRARGGGRPRGPSPGLPIPSARRWCPPRARTNRAPPACPLREPARPRTRARSTPRSRARRA